MDIWLFLWLIAIFLDHSVDSRYEDHYRDNNCNLQNYCIKTYNMLCDKFHMDRVDTLVKYYPVAIR